MLNTIRNSFSRGLPGIIELVISLLVFVFALSLHEWAHAYAAHKMGDDTAKNYGRMTLNPLKHLDPIGTLLLIFIGVGYGKPVPVNPYNFKDRKKGEIITSLAGVATNIITAFIALVIYKLFLISGLMAIGTSATNSGFVTVISYVMQIMANFASISCSLAVFNLFPVPPLDGYHVVKELFLAKANQNTLRQFERAMPLVFMVLVVSGVFSGVFNTVTGSLFRLMTKIIGL